MQHGLGTPAHERHLTRVVTATWVVWAVLAAWRAPAARADTPAVRGAFSGTASADGVRVSLKVPGFLIIESFVDGGGPSAQASLDSLGTSRAFASLPYPGDTVVSLPGLVGTLTGKSIPGYPFFVSTSSPTTPDSHADQPAYHLASHSHPSSSSASAQAGEATTTGIEGGAFSTATVTAQDDGSVVSASDSRIDLSLGALRLSGLDAAAAVVLGPDGKTTRTSSLRLGALSIGGITVGVTDQGLVLGGLALPLGNLLGGLSRMLSLGDTTVEFLPAVRTADSILSAGLVISTAAMVPVVNHPAQVSITVGRAFAMASGTVAAATPVGPVPVGDVSDHPGSAAPATAAIPALGGQTLPAAPAPVPAAAPPPAVVPATVVRRLPMTVSRWTLYPMVLLAAVLVLGSGVAQRATRKERWSWSS